MKFHREHTGKKNEDTEHWLYEAIAAIKTPEEARQFIEDLCTPTEIQAMADRWNVVPYLKKGMSYREIHEKTKVSITTSGRVARFIALGSDGYNIIYERVERKSHEPQQKVKNSHTKVRASQ